MDVQAEACPPHVHTVDEPPGGATVPVTTAEFQVRSVPGCDEGEDELKSGAEAQTPAAVDPITEIESEDAAREEVDRQADWDAGKRAGKTVGSSCSNESCVPTPGCRICFQGAEQVKQIKGLLRVTRLVTMGELLRRVQVMSCELFTQYRYIRNNCTVITYTIPCRYTQSGLFDCP